MPPSSLIFIPNDPGSPIASANAGDVQVSDLSQDELRKRNWVAEVANLTQDQSQIILDQIETALGHLEYVHTGFLRLVKTDHPGASIAFQHVSQSEEDQDPKSRNLKFLLLNALLRKVDQEEEGIHTLLESYLYNETIFLSYHDLAINPLGKAQRIVELQGTFSISEPTIENIALYLQQIEVMDLPNAQWVLLELENTLRMSRMSRRWADATLQLSRSKDFPHHLSFVQCQKDQVTAQIYGAHNNMLSMQVLEALVKKGGIECPYINQFIAKRDADESQKEASLLQQDPDPRIESLASKDARIEFTIRECSNQLEETDRQLEELVSQLEALESPDLITSDLLNEKIKKIQSTQLIAENIHRLLTKLHLEVVTVDTEPQSQIGLDLATALNKSEALMQKAQELQKTAIQLVFDSDTAPLLKKFSAQFSPIEQSMHKVSTYDPKSDFQEEKQKEYAQYFHSLDFMKEIGHVASCKIEEGRTWGHTRLECMVAKLSEIKDHLTSIEKLQSDIEYTLPCYHWREQDEKKIKDILTQLSIYSKQVDTLRSQYSIFLDESNRFHDTALECELRADHCTEAFLEINRYKESACAAPPATTSPALELSDDATLPEAPDTCAAPPATTPPTLLELPDGVALSKALDALKDTSLIPGLAADRIRIAFTHFYPILQNIHYHLNHYQTRVSFCNGLILDTPVTTASPRYDDERTELNQITSDATSARRITSSLSRRFSLLHKLFEKLYQQRTDLRESLQVFVNALASAKEQSDEMNLMALLLNREIHTISSNLNARAQEVQRLQNQENRSDDPFGLGDLHFNFPSDPPPEYFEADPHPALHLPPAPSPPAPSLPRKILNSIQEFFISLWNRFFPSRGQPTRNEIPPPYSERAPITNVPPPDHPQPPAYTP